MSMAWEYDLCTHLLTLRSSRIARISYPANPRLPGTRGAWEVELSTTLSNTITSNQQLNLPQLRFVSGGSRLAPFDPQVYCVGKQSTGIGDINAQWFLISFVHSSVPFVMLGLVLDVLEISSHIRAPRSTPTGRGGVSSVTAVTATTS